MLSGEHYRAGDPELVADRRACARLLAAYNATLDPQTRHEMLDELLGGVGPGVEIRSPFWCDYGTYTFVGGGVFANFGLVVLDCASVTIGDGTQIGPYVQLLAADHPRDPAARRSGVEMAAPVVIGRNVWIGAGVIVCPGVTVGDDSVIGAGSIVTRDLPAGVVAAGNPCRVLRTLAEG
ncbi:MAG: sugar O-acetyltransferase [Acidimicrobiales bacterium]|nr:sugar O-acetyltransferase [Acidimicrobiales bacterium]